MVAPGLCDGGPRAESSASRYLSASASYVRVPLAMRERGRRWPAIGLCHGFAHVGSWIRRERQSARATSVACRPWRGLASRAPESAGHFRPPSAARGRASRAPVGAGHVSRPSPVEGAGVASAREVRPSLSPICGQGEGVASASQRWPRQSPVAGEGAGAASAEGRRPCPWLFVGEGEAGAGASHLHMLETRAQGFTGAGFPRSNGGRGRQRTLESSLACKW